MLCRKHTIECDVHNVYMIDQWDYKVMDLCIFISFKIKYLNTSFIIIDDKVNVMSCHVMSCHVMSCHVILTWSMTFVSTPRSRSISIIWTCPLSAATNNAVIMIPHCKWKKYMGLINLVARRRWECSVLLQCFLKSIHGALGFKC